LDKLLGIYLLVRLSEGMIVINPAIRVFLMLTGALTIIAAVMMALVQHNLKRLLGYHAVSQVGYMVLGIATGNPLGLIGGVFHMLNNTVYKSCLFLVGGNIEHRAKTTELDELGGLAKAMPVTYITAFIASLSISGIPPFNGFFSKWLIYQGLIVSIGQWHSRLGIGFGVFCLVAAMVGSGLTLASFLKLMHAVFMGQANPHLPKDIREVPTTMWVPAVILAVVCVIFGVFAFVLPLKIIVIPALSAYQQFGFASVIGSWLPLSATILVLAALGLGIGVVRMRGLPSPLRQDEAFVGGESQALEPATRPTGVEFYLAVEELKPLRFIYAKARDGFFDLYEQSKKIFTLSKMFAYLHNGVLPTYMVWVLLGMVGLFLYLLK
jgi:formate hydrogenlyase subunit 3/multisubunit Na+/H+ antiporter MnhD subunit